MIIRTEVKCLCCARVSWYIELERGAPWQTASVVWPQRGGRLPARPRCTHCGGPVFLDEDFPRARMTDVEWRAQPRRVQCDESNKPPSLLPLRHGRETRHRTEVRTGKRAA